MKKILGLVAGVSIAALLLFNPREKKEQKITFYELFEKALNEKGIEMNKAIQMAADMVGAIDGKKFITAHGNIEIYQFESDHPALKKALALHKFSADGTTFYDVVVNGCYIMCVTSLPQEIIDTFLSIEITE